MRRRSIEVGGGLGDAELGGPRGPWLRGPRRGGARIGVRSASVGRIGVRAADLVAIAAPLGIGVVGGAISAPAIRTWYRTLDKPSWNPPDAVFGPVWTTLYILMGVALALARRAAPERSPRTEAAFGLQLALNLGWTAVFFGRRDIGGALVAVGALWAAIVVAIVELARARPLAGALLLPYLGWVTFAAALNLEVWRRNRVARA